MILKILICIGITVLHLICNVCSLIPPTTQWKRNYGILQRETLGKRLFVKERLSESSEMINEDEIEISKYWNIGPTMLEPEPRSLPKELLDAVLGNVHPSENQEDLGKGVFIEGDWRKAWFTYEDDGVIDPKTGFATYDIDEIDGEMPDDLVGTLYRNGPGKFGVNDERVAHVLDSDGLVIQISMPPPKNGKRKIKFRSSFIKTEGFLADIEAGEFTQRGTFGTCIRGLPNLFPGKKEGLNKDPCSPSTLSKVTGNIFKTDIKNTANTQVISFGGKVLALFEAGLPYELDPSTLDTIGEYTMNGSLTSGKLPVKVNGLPEDLQPEFLGGDAHTAHPKICQDTGHLVGWSWVQLPMEKSLEVRVTEWHKDGFRKIAEETYILKNCELAPHDIAMTRNAIVFKINSLSMNTGPYILGLKGPAASLEMNGEAPVSAYVVPRPCAKKKFETFTVKIPACFSIHFSHAYEDIETGNIVAHFSGWPPSDSKDFLGSWGGFSPLFSKIPVTYIWRLEIDPKLKKTVNLQIAKGSSNCCAEHPLVHPYFNTRKAENVYAVASNVIGDASAPCGYVNLKVESNDSDHLSIGEKNSNIEAFWFGTRYFAGEPLIVPKLGGNLEDEKDAYLLGMVKDSVKHKSFLAIFDLKKSLNAGPICKLWMKSPIPHGLHGCFNPMNDALSSYFC